MDMAMPLLTPSRRRGIEILDDPSRDPALAVRSLRDVAVANRLFGGKRAILRALSALIERGLAEKSRADRALRRHTPTSQISLTLLDVGTGLADIPLAAMKDAHQQGFRLETIGFEVSPEIARAAEPSCTWAMVGDALHLPFPDRSVDFVTCSQVLHHFDGPAAETLLRECARVARVGVVIGELRRSWLAVAGLWAASFVLGFHPVSRHDGIVSILRGFTVPELRQLVRRATGARVSVRRQFGWRVTATWTTASVRE
jgi:SAM-dependent methyltransferase